MYDQNPMLWNARIHNTDGRLNHSKTPADNRKTGPRPQVVVSLLATVVVLGAALSGLIA